MIGENLQAFARRRIPDSCCRIFSARGDKLVFPWFGTRAPLHMYEFCRVSATHHASPCLQIPCSCCPVVRATRQRCRRMIALHLVDVVCVTSGNRKMNTEGRFAIIRRYENLLERADWFHRVQLEYVYHSIPTADHEPRVVDPCDI